VPDTNEILERKEEENGEERERKILPVKKWKIESKTKMDECRAE
jgi:hypothetical protein